MRGSKAQNKEKLGYKSQRQSISIKPKQTPQHKREPNIIITNGQIQLGKIITTLISLSKNMLKLHIF